jgi:hypothetical protein
MPSKQAERKRRLSIYDNNMGNCDDRLTAYQPVLKYASACCLFSSSGTAATSKYLLLGFEINDSS